MKIHDKRIFAALNFDDADEAMENGDMRDALNIRVGVTESGDDGVVENVKGNTSLFEELNFSLPVGLNKTLNTCTDDQYNRLIWFNYNSNSNHGIYAYNNDTNTIDTVMVSSIFNWTTSTKINSSDILQNLLSWTDDGRPKSINVARAIAGDYGATIIEELITDAKVAPMLPPVVTSYPTTEDVYIKSLKSFQFIYRYVFHDGCKGAWSTVSKLVPTGYNGTHINRIKLDISGCELFTKVELRNVIEYVELASRELYTFSFNQFARVTTADVVSDSGILYYYDTESKTTVDTDETALAYYEVPIKAGTVAYQNDRKFYADCTEGYDAFDLNLSNINTQVIPASGSIPYLSDCDTHTNERYLKPDSEYNYAIAWYDKYGRKSGASTVDDLMIQTLPQISNDYKANVLEFTVNAASTLNYPPYAEKFEVLRSENKTVSWFAQGRANNILYCTGYDSANAPQYIISDPGPGNENSVDSNAVEIHIDISNWTKYGINMPYIFTEGDRVTFFTMGGHLDEGATNDLKGLKIKSQRGSLLIIDYNGVGRTNLNDGMMALTDHIDFPMFDTLISRFIVGDNGVALYSIGGGNSGVPSYSTTFANVKKIPIPSTTANLFSVSIIYSSVPECSSIDFYIVGSGGYFLKGNVNPITKVFSGFTTIATGTTEDLNCIQSDWTLHNMSDLIIVGNAGTILKYNVAGNTITTLTSGTTENLNHVFKDRTSGAYVAVGDNGTILRSTNGTTWTTISTDICQNFNSVFLAAGTYGCIVGDEGVCLMTQDAGLTWSQVNLSTRYDLLTVDGEGSATNKVYIGGQYGFIGYADLVTPGLINDYDSLTTKDIHRIFSFSFGGGYDNLGFLVGEDDLLKDIDFVTSTFTDYSSYVTALYGSTILNFKAKFEIYTPKTNAGATIFYENGDAHLVGTNYTFTKGKGDDGDVFFISKDFKGIANSNSWVMKGDPIFSMTPNAFATTGTWDKDLGRPNIVLLYPELQTRRNIIRWSDKYIQNSQINGLSNFQPLNFEVVPNEYGIVKKITAVESVMLINCEREVATAYIDQSLITGASGQQSVGLSSKVFNNIRKLTGGFGCTNPESITKYLGHTYFYSSNKQVFCRYNNSNGVFPISEYKARTYFYNKDPLLVITGVEPRFRNCLVSITETIDDDSLSVISTIPVSTSPYFPTYDPVNKRVWVGNSGTNTISVIEVATNTVVQTITVQSGPRNPTYDPDTQRMYCSCTSGYVVVVDCATYDIIATLMTGGTSRPGTYDPINHRIYVPNGIGTDTVSVISTASNTIIDTITGITDPTTPLYDPIYERMYFGGGASPNVNVVSTASNTVVQSIVTIGVPNNGCYDPVSKQMFFGNGAGATTVSVIDTTDYSISTISVGLSPLDTKFIPEIGRVVVSNFGAASVSVINPATNLVVNTLSTGSGPRGGTFDTLNNLLFIPNQSGASVSVFDANNDFAFVKTIGVGTSPILYALFIEGVQYVYVSNIGSASVSVISTTGGGETIAFQEGTNKWISKFSFSPEKYGYVKTKMFSFLSGELWIHNNNSLYNNFYGIQYTSQVKPVFNREPSIQKSFNCVSLESDSDTWTSPSITTAQGQETFLVSGHFERINNELWADILQDINTPNMVSQDDALLNGNYIQSNALTVKLENDSTSAIKLRFANLYSSINQRTNK